MTIKEYKEANGLTYGELLEKVKPIEPKITVPLLSYMCSGFIAETPAISAWLTKQTKSELTPMEAAVLLYLKDAGRAVSRQELKEFTKLPDRQNRKIIENLRGRGEWIVNGEDGTGYKYTKEYREVEDFVWTYTARSKTIFRNAAAMLNNDPNQTGMNF
jgi:predicted HTH transcriptional regulator